MLSSSSPSLPPSPTFSATIPRLLSIFPLLRQFNWPRLSTKMVASEGHWSVSALLKNPILEIFSFAYVVFQTVLNYIFSPVPPPPSAAAASLPQKRIAVIGAGLTGVSSAAHCVGHGFDVQLFEARSKDKGLGGIWSVCHFINLTLPYSGVTNRYTESQLYILAPNP